MPKCVILPLSSQSEKFGRFTALAAILISLNGDKKNITVIASSSHRLQILSSRWSCALTGLNTSLPVWLSRNQSSALPPWRQSSSFRGYILFKSLIYFKRISFQLFISGSLSLFSKHQLVFTSGSSRRNHTPLPVFTSAITLGVAVGKTTKWPMLACFWLLASTIVCLFL